MKNFIYLLTLMFFVGIGSVQSQIMVFTVSGTVTTMGTGVPVPNHPVTIAPLDSTLGFSVTAITGVNGVYMASITLPPVGAQIPVVVSTYGNCGPNDFYSTIIYSSPIGNAIADFAICDSTTTTYCNASFSYIGGFIGDLAFYDETYSSAPVASWSWTFGDGTTSTSQNPIHTYSATGLYSVCLTIVTTDSCTSSYCEDIYYGGGPTLCSAGYYYYPGPTGNMYEFAFTDMSVGSVIDWNWTFGDGSTSTLQNPVHTYSQMGAYEVCLSIFTSDSCSSTWCEYVYVDSMINPPGCEAYFFYGTTPGSMSPMFYDNSFSATPIISWSWTFGDGGTSTDQNPPYSYSTTGWYNVCLTIVTTDSCTSTYCEDIYYGGSSILCSAGYYYSPGPTGNIYEIAFADMSMGSVIDWNWTFGDGTTSTLQNPVHTYSQMGAYEVCLSIFTSDSCSSTWCEYVYVDSMINPPGCESYFYYIGGFIGDLAFYDGSFSSTPIVSWDWTFGDGTTSTLQDPIHTYNSTGWYTVCLTIVTTDSCTSTYCEDIYYGGGSTLCSAGYYYSPGPTGNIYEIAFADMSMGSVIEWNWTFGDGTTSTLQNPVHTYSQMGAYEVCLSIFTSDSCSSTWCEYVYVDSIINPPGCEAYFYYNIGIFSNSSFFDASWSSTPILSWNWTFGDGTSSTDQNPIHTYNAVGWYNVCLTILTTDSCISTYCEDIFYSGAGGNCEAFFTNSIGSPSNPLEIYFTDASIGSVISWIWSFGDGTSSTDQNPVHQYSTSGVYEVCLAIFTSDSCSSTYCEFISVQNNTQFYNVSGAVWAGTDPVNSGTAMLMGINGSIFITDIDTGGYLFTTIPTGTYIVYAIPSFVNYPTYVPTYHDSALFWADAIELVVSSSDLINKDIFLIDYSTTTVGPCIISGSIIWPGTKTSDTYKDRLDFSLEDISMYLFDMDENLLEYTSTDVTGYFEFSNLPYGTYKLYVELTGHETYPAIITLDEGNASVTDIIINVVDGTIVYDVEEIEAGINNMKLYPNPVIDILFVEFMMNSNSNVNCTILNAFGQEVISSNKSMTNGLQQIKLDVSDLAAGIYFVNVKQDNSISKVLKFIK